jgi:molybdopterin molybdotransferase
LTEFLRVITADQFVEQLRRFARLPADLVPLTASLHRVLAADVIGPEDLPERARSTVDGYAVRAEDTFGASDAIPALLEVAGAVEMGTIPNLTVHPGQAAQIATGGFLPSGSDAVVMIEYTNRAGGAGIEVTHPLTVGVNVIDQGEDVRAGELVLYAGRVMRPQEIGILAALGIPEVSVYRKARVAVISTGDEVVSMNQAPGPGQIRDANAHSIAALVRARGADPVAYEIIPDSARALRATLEQALQETDVVTLSGGSSVGVRDLMVEVVTSLPGSELLAHGIAIRPGKPTLLAALDGKAIFGLPGHPVSALLVAQVFLAPFLDCIQGRTLAKGPIGERVKAVLPSSFHSTIGLEEYVRVQLAETEAGYEARPIFGKSGMLSTMVKADGVVVIPMQVDGLAKGEVIEVIRI